MKYFIVAALLLTACAPTPIPVVEPTAIPLPTNTLPAVSPTTPIETILPTVPPTIEASPTPEPLTDRVSPVDSMPQVYIPAGTFRMGGMDVRRLPNEVPEHDVTLDA